jgi:ABC-type phosphate transport system substrate-binding protein
MWCQSQALVAADNIVAIVNKKSTLQKLTLAQMKAVFLGETRYAAPGVLVEVTDRDRNSDIYKEFYSNIASMTPKEVSVHWARKVFTGEAPPPARIAGDDADAIAMIKSKPDAITYIFEKNANANVRIVFSVQSK